MEVTQQQMLEAATLPEGATLPVPRAVLVFAHSDDEVIALGGRLGRFQSAHFVHGTDGAPHNGQDSRAHGFASLDQYRRARAEELRRALERAGLHHISEEWMGISDQEAALQLPHLTQRLLRIFDERQPEVIFTHPYEGGHPDHDACAFAVHHAVALREQSQKSPLIIEGAFYHAGPEGIETGNFLSNPQRTEEIVYPLSPEERLRKQALFECFATQKEVLKYFKVESEAFRVAPQYDFRAAPHEGQVFYDSFPWGMTSRRFCELATEAESELEKETVGTCR
jgi:LmbE family N-acetylglucosaminyl deacetylase